MSTPLEIKVCGMTRPDNMAEVAALGVDYVGLIFHPASPRYAADCDAVAVAAVDVRRVGVFVDSAPDAIMACADRFGLYAVQLHGSESPEMCSALRGHGFEVWKAVGIAGTDDIDRLAAYSGCIDRLVFDRKSARHGGTGRKFDWTLIEGHTFPAPFMLGGGIGPDDAQAIASLAHPHLVGIDLNSRFESSPGVKSPRLIASFITNLKTLIQI